MKTALLVIGLVLLALILPFFLPSPASDGKGDPDSNLPWQIQLDDQGNSRVFGLTPGRSTLAQVRQRLGNDMDIAIVAGPGEVGDLEAYYTQVPLGFVLARLILTADLSPDAITAMRERALKAERMESSTRKITLHPDDLAAVENTPIRAFSLIPNVNLDEATIIQRFGQPVERIAVGANLTHFLYPHLGLDVVLDRKGKELLQYVAPRDFEARIRAPLRAAQAKAVADAAAKEAEETARKPAKEPAN
ncbi:MAG: hypothetical protein WBI41_06420 [Azovibrio sp.]|uniref:hypothetical protein n=1 Tax=Azovibrio sp. TaxID=1872673 RepID=UPI003C78FFB8